MIPFNVPYIVGTEAALVSEALERRHFSGDGHFTRRATELIERITSTPMALLTTSCTHALELAASLLDIRPGDEVIMPSFTFVSTANAFVLRGAVPVFVDVRADTGNIDERQIERAITPLTRAIVVVHYGGVACEMDAIMSLGTAHGIAVVEDAAHGFGGSYKGRPLGTIGALGTLSFHETKNVQCGEGGALLVNDASLAERSEILREKGTNRKQFLRGEVDKYTWVDIGSSYLPSELLAAFLTCQLEAFCSIRGLRMAIWRRYHDALHDWMVEHSTGMIVEPADCQHPAHLFAIVHRDLATRRRFIDHMADGGVRSSFHYVPLHSSPAGRRLVGDVSLPVTDALADGLVRLPLYPDLSPEAVEQVIEGVLAFRG